MSYSLYIHRWHGTVPLGNACFRTLTLYQRYFAVRYRDGNLFINQTG